MTTTETPSVAVEATTTAACVNGTAFQADKNDVIRELFVKTADQTYVVARWCFLNKLHLDFYWNGLQAVEKYLKASLLFNDHSAISQTPNGKEYGHNLERLFASVRKYAIDLLPKTLKKPKDLQIVYWLPETTIQFVARLNRLGDPGNRYNLFGFAQHPDDLYKLDMLIFALRRLCVNLGDNYFAFASEEDKPLVKSNATILKENPNYQFNRIGSRLADLTGDKATDAVKAAALMHNFPFTPPNYEHGGLPAYSSSSNPVLYRRIIFHAQQGGLKPEDRQQVIALADWVIANIRLPRDARQELEDARAALAAPEASPEKTGG